MNSFTTADIVTIVMLACNLIINLWSEIQRANFQMSLCNGKGCNLSTEVFMKKESKTSVDETGLND